MKDTYFSSLSKLKAFVDKQQQVTQHIAVFQRVENTMGKGENANYCVVFLRGHKIRHLLAQD